MRDFKGYVPSTLGGVNGKKLETMADMPKEKACRDCKITKPNDFDNFGKRWHQTRTNYVTTDVCNSCKRMKISNSMRARWAKDREADEFLNKQFDDKVKRKLAYIQEAVQLAEAKGEDSYLAGIRAGHEFDKLNR